MEQWSHSFTIAAQAASPSRATRSANPAIASAQSASTGRPHSASASANGSRPGSACTSAEPPPPAAQVDVRLRVAHGEGREPEPEPLAVGEGEVVGAGDPHRAHLGVEAVGERLASVWTRPPTRARASSTIGSCPARASSQAATSPAMPAPTITTRFGRPSRRGRPCRAIRSSASCESGRMPIRRPPCAARAARRYNPPAANRSRIPRRRERHEGRHAADRDRVRHGDVADQVRPRARPRRSASTRAASGLRKVLIVTDPGLAALGLPERVRALLDEQGVKADVFDGVAVEPTDRSMEEAADYARTKEVDGFVAVGGGQRDRHRQGREPPDVLSGPAARLREQARRPGRAGPGPAQAPHRHAHDGRHRQRDHGRPRDPRARPARQGRASRAGSCARRSASSTR